MAIKQPYLLFLGDVPDQLAAKTAQGIVDWRREQCLGQMRLPGCQADLGLADMSLAEASKAGAKTLVIGAVNASGTLPDHWIAPIMEALNTGFDIASGLHMHLSDHPAIAETARQNGQLLHDIRRNSQKFETGKGVKRTGLRLLTVGTDCSVGKKYASLALEKEMRARGFNADFRATGQTGILISGNGIALDAIIADFIAGAAEWLSPDAPADHWDIIEGQGSLFHPSFAGVSLGLLHGSQPDAFIVCHEPTRQTMRGISQTLPTIAQVIEMTVNCGRLTNAAIQCAGIAINTQALDVDEARLLLEKTGKEHNLPATDPVRFGSGPIIDRITQLFGAIQNKK